MSSSDPRLEALPSAWALDELEVPDVFTPLNHDTYCGPAVAADARAGSEQADDDAVSARVAEQVARMRAQLEQEAFARGHAAGVVDTREQAHAEVSRVIAALSQATDLVQQHEQRWLANIEENLAAIAVTIAQHLIHRELTSDPSVVTDLITRSLQQFPLERRITVRLHPDDLMTVQDVMANGGIEGTDGREVRWQGDPHIMRGGCLVDGRERVLDGRLDTALERAYRSLSQVQA